RRVLFRSLLAFKTVRGADKTNPKMKKVRLCFHGRCFDGTASAALFYRFYREKFDMGAEFEFTGMTHRAAQPWEGGIFDGDENVIVDFKYSSSPRSEEHTSE